MVSKKQGKSIKKKETKISNSGIYLCCKGGFFDKKKNKWININQAGGFIWSLTPLT